MCSHIFYAKNDKINLREKLKTWQPFTNKGVLDKTDCSAQTEGALLYGITENPIKIKKILNRLARLK